MPELYSKTIPELAQRTQEYITQNNNETLLQLQCIVLIKCTESLSSKIDALNESINNTSKSADELTNKVIVLNSRLSTATWFIALAGIAAVVVAVVALCVN